MRELTENTRIREDHPFTCSQRGFVAAMLITACGGGSGGSGSSSSSTSSSSSGGGNNPPPNVPPYTLSATQEKPPGSFPPGAFYLLDVERLTVTSVAAPYMSNAMPARVVIFLRRFQRRLLRDLQAAGHQSAWCVPPARVDLAMTWLNHGRIFASVLDDLTQRLLIDRDRTFCAARPRRATLSGDEE